MNTAKTTTQNKDALVHKAEQFLEKQQISRAAGSLQLAASQAFAAAEYADAVALWTRSLSLVPDHRPVQRYAILLQRQVALGKIGRRSEQEQDLVSLSTLANMLGDDRRQVEVAAHMAAYKLDSGDYQDAITIAQLAMRLANSVRAEAHQILLHQVWGRALVRQGDFAQASDQLHKALANARATRDFLAEADSLRYLGVYYSDQGQFGQAQAHYVQAQHLYKELGDDIGRADIFNNMGNVAKAEGQIGEALAYWEQALAIYEALNNRPGLCRLLINHGAGCITIGYYAEARRHNEAALALSKEIKLQFGQALANLNLAVIHTYEGAPRTAEIYGQAALELARNMGSRQIEGFALTTLGRIFSQTEEFAAAEEMFWQALALWSELDQDVMAVETHASMAQMAYDRGDLAAALDHVNQIMGQVQNGYALDGVESDMEIYLSCYRVLQAHHDKRAENLLSAAHQTLQKRAGQIKCAETRESFLNNVKFHRELIEAHKQREIAL